MTLEAHDVTLPAPFSAEVLACWISEFWLGMEMIDLVGGPRERNVHRVALDAMQQLLESIDARVAKGSTSAKKKRKGK